MAHRIAAQTELLRRWWRSDWSAKREAERPGCGGTYLEVAVAVKGGGEVVNVLGIELLVKLQTLLRRGYTHSSVRGRCGCQSS